MVQSLHTRFVIMWAILVTFGFILGAIFGPLGPDTNFRIAMGVILVGTVIAYLVTYRADVFASDTS